MSFHKVIALIVVLATGTALLWRKPAPPNLDNQINPLTVSSDYDPQDRIGYLNGVPFESPEDLIALDVSPQDTMVLGDQTFDKRIEVDLATQTLTAFEGDAAVHSFPVSTGLWGKTPTGTFRIWSKFRYTKMEGGSKERRTYYYLPNVPYVMFFSNDEIAGSRGFSIHGAYWHDNFGVPMSHGCVNMRTEDAGVIYEWANPVLPEGKRSGLATDDNPGTEVIIYGVAPGQ